VVKAKSKQKSLSNSNNDSKNNTNNYSTMASAAMCKKFMTLDPFCVLCGGDAELIFSPNESR